MTRPPPTSTLFPYTTLFRSAYAQNFAHRMLLGPAHRRQARALVRHPGQSQKQAQFARPRAPQHTSDAQVIRHVFQRIEDTKDRTTDGVPTCEMIAFSPESPTQGLHARGLPMGQVGQGALADLVTVTKRLAQQDRWRRSAIGNDLNIHGFIISLIKQKTRESCGITWVHKGSKNRTNPPLINTLSDGGGGEDPSGVVRSGSSVARGLKLVVACA